MAYRLDGISGTVVGALRKNPRLTMADIASELGIHRHTLQRAMGMEGLSLAALRKTLVIERLIRHCECGPPESLKEVWVEMGFASASSFARYIRRVTGFSPSDLCD